MKLWWPHAEALIALLMAYKETRDQRFIEKFDLVFQYTFAHVSNWKLLHSSSTFTVLTRRPRQTISLMLATLVYETQLKLLLYLNRF